MLAAYLCQLDEKRQTAEMSSTIADEPNGIACQVRKLHHLQSRYQNLVKRSETERLNFCSDSAYSSDESPTFNSPLRCGACKTLSHTLLDRRRLPCGHNFCLACSTSASPERSLTLYCPSCGDQSIAPFSHDEPAHRLPSDFPMSDPEHPSDSVPNSLRGCLQTLQTQIDSLKRNIETLERQKVSCAVNPSSALATGHLDGIFDRLFDILRQQQTAPPSCTDRANRTIRDLANYQRKLNEALSKCKAEKRGTDHWRQGVIEAKNVLRTLAARAKFEHQRAPIDDSLEVQISHLTVDGVTNGHSDIHPQSSPSNCSSAPSSWTINVTGEGTRRCRRNIKSTVYVQAKNDNGERVRLDKGDLSAYLLSASSGKRVALVAIRESSLMGGGYELTYYLTREGAYHLVVKLSNRHIGGSPFPVRCVGDDANNYEYKNASYTPSSRCSVHSSGPLSGTHSRSSADHRTAVSSSQSRTHSKSPHRTGASSRAPLEDDLMAAYGSHGRGSGQFSNPQGICCTPEGRVIVADSNNQCVQVFDSAGQCTLKFGSRGRMAGEMQRPTGVCTLPTTGNILVADYDNRWVSVHEPDGRYLGKFGGSKMLGPRGLAVDADDHVIVVDSKASVVSVYDLHKLKFVRQFGSRGDRVDQLAGPHYCAVNTRTNLLYITDFHHHCVKVFDCQGRFQFAFGSLGEGNGQFQAPTGIAIDGNQNVLVADWGNSRIQIFDSTGSFLSYVNSNAHPLFGPQGLSMSAEGNVVIADTGNHCYKIYRYLTE